MFKSILVVCVGNICRSPMAEAMLLEQCRAKGITVASAGVGALVGKPMDATALAILKENGLDHPTHQARQITREMVHQYDLILTMDDDNLRDILALAKTPEEETKVKRFTDFCTEHDLHEVPDPYYGGDAGFELVADLMEDGCAGLLEQVRKEIP